MTTVWKFIMPMTNDAAISMPLNAQILKLAEQEGDLVFWALVDTEAQKELRFFRVTKTGESIDFAIRKHIGTVEMSLSGAVWHVFEGALTKGRRPNEED